jgi:hypothetical protein
MTESGHLRRLSNVLGMSANPPPDVSPFARGIFGILSHCPVNGSLAVPRGVEPPTFGLGSC